MYTAFHNYNPLLFVIFLTMEKIYKISIIIGEAGVTYKLVKL